jgi:hypothetical protein
MSDYSHVAGCRPQAGFQERDKPVSRIPLRSIRATVIVLFPYRRLSDNLPDTFMNFVDLVLCQELREPFCRRALPLRKQGRHVIDKLVGNEVVVYQ